jgi:hypothetical protein
VAITPSSARWRGAICLGSADPDLASACAFDALRAGITSKIAEVDPAHVREKRLRKRLIRENESLAAHSDHLSGKFAELLGEAVAQDLGDDPNDLRPRHVAAAAAAAIRVIDDMPDDDIEHSAETIDSLLAFLRGGLAALQDQTRA